VDTGANSNIIIRIKVLSSSERNIQQIPLEPTNMNCTERNDCLARSIFSIEKIPTEQPTKTGLDEEKKIYKLLRLIF